MTASAETAKTICLILFIYLTLLGLRACALSQQFPFHLEIVYVFQKITSFAFLVFVKYIDTGMSTDCESPAYLS